ncbi:MAG: flavohemoglobin expression-modulating QEGLA motif protein [Deltaproteobacteria bacterium]|nr:flavohemoglobin expression-modulating QEGLA motif protein [Deltaproteobacteria bacterium]MBW2543054.1 flavohemoglobin expression-modulating QEGLA motif protein [Deltaproteobacteria bacterium]
MVVKKKPVELISESFVASACQRLKEGKPVRRKVPPWGRLHIDRPLPFLVVYRRPADREDEGTERLAVGEACYLLASGERSAREGLSRLVAGIAEVMSASFGAFLVIEMWSAPEAEAEAAGASWKPGFRIVRPKRGRMTSTVDALDRALSEVKIKGTFAGVEVSSAVRVRPPGLQQLIPSDLAAALNVRVIGIEIEPAFRDEETGTSYPLVRRALHNGIARALKRAVFEFTRRQTSHRPPHYQALGRHSVVKAVWEVDRKLAEVSNGFDFLLQVTPTNPDSAWSEFRRKRFDAAPDFSSRPLRFEPSLSKRKLFQIPIEKIEDPTLYQLFLDQQVELDRKLTLLHDRGTPQFLYGSLQLYGGVDESLLNLAYEILNRVPPRSRDESPRGAIDAKAFAASAEKEIEHYRALYPKVRSRVEVRKDFSGLMVSRGNLLVGAQLKVPRSRVEALIAHEVGTHVVTYINGRAQPFRQLYVGLPGYDELQEGIAVLSEFLVGGFSRPRLRLLAARVLAVHRMVEGANFVEVFRELDRAHDFAQRTAFTVAMRVFRGGGLTKDAVYLRGLVDLLAYLREGGKLDPLLVGKLGAEHVPIVEELQWRNVLTAPPLKPRYLDDPAAIDRLEEIRRGVSVLNLVKGGRR